MPVKKKNVPVKIYGRVRSKWRRYIKKEDRTSLTCQEDPADAPFRELSLKIAKAFHIERGEVIIDCLGATDLYE